MIVEAIFMLGFRAIMWLVGWIPELPIAYTAVYIVQGVGGIYGYLNSFVNVSEVVLVSMFCFSIDHVAFLTRALKYLKQMIPFI